MHGCIFWVGRRVGWGGGGGGLASVERVKGVRFEDGCFWRKVVYREKNGSSEKRTSTPHGDMIYTYRRATVPGDSVQYPVACTPSRLAYRSQCG